MKTILHMITQNEAYGYLDCTLTHNLQYFDEAYVVDDCSTDDTVEILRSHRVKYLTKPDFLPDTLGNDELFRFFSWITMLDAIQPDTGDWVVSLDPDDLIIGDLKKAIVILHAGGFTGGMVHCQYLWEENPPMKRVDGLWDSLSSVRIGVVGDGDQTFDPDNRLPRRSYGKDSFIGDLPVQVLNLSFLSELDKMTIYESLAKNSHVESILTPAQCAPVEAPEIWEGVKHD